MHPETTILPCRTCGEKFACAKLAGGIWKTAFNLTPPSEVCREHGGSALCRWNTHKARVRLWRKVRPAFDTGQPHAFVTIVPPNRLVRFDHLDSINLENEKRSMRRVLRDMLPCGTKAVAIFDINVIDDHTMRPRERWWAPHFHVLVVGMTADDVRKLGRWPYQKTELFMQPVHRSDAKAPKGALFYALKHIDDVRAKAVFWEWSDTEERGSRRRRLAGEERRLLESFVRANAISDHFCLKGFKRSAGPAGKSTASPWYDLVNGNRPAEPKRSLRNGRERPNVHRR